MVKIMKRLGRMMMIHMRLLRIMNVMEKLVRMMIYMMRDWRSWGMMIMMWRMVIIVWRMMIMMRRMMIWMWWMVIMVIWMDIRVRVSIWFRMMMMVKVCLDDIRRRPYFPRWMPVIRPCSCLGSKGLRGQRSPVTNLETILKASKNSFKS